MLLERHFFRCSVAEILSPASVTSMVSSSVSPFSTPVTCTGYPSSSFPALYEILLPLIFPSFIVHGLDESSARLRLVPVKVSPVTWKTHSRRPTFPSYDVSPTHVPSNPSWGAALNGPARQKNTRTPNKRRNMVAVSFQSSIQFRLIPFR